MNELVYLWEFRVSPDMEDAFVAAYGPNGGWVRLFRTAEGWLGTELHRDLDDPGRYLTIDRWTSRAARDAFRAVAAEAWEDLDHRCERLTISERPLGDFGRIG